MEIKIPHRIAYNTTGTTPISDVIESMLGAERVLFEVAPFLEACTGVLVEKISISVGEITQQSPLKELFWASLFIAFQGDLEKEVPPMINSLLQSPIPHKYDTVVTLIFCLLLFYGVDFIYKNLEGVVHSTRIKRQLEGLIDEVSREHGISTEKIRNYLGSRYSKGRVRLLTQAAVRVFIPSKNQDNAPLLIGSRQIDHETVSDIPSEAQRLEAVPVDSTDPLENVRIELHAQDIDSAKRGWAAVIPEISRQRLKMELYPPLKPEQIYTRTEIRGDVILVSKPESDGTSKPYMFHLVRIHE